MDRLQPDPAVVDRIEAIRAEQDPWTRARLAGADILALIDLFDESVAALWQLHARQRGAKDVADNLGVPITMLLTSISRSQRVT